MGVLKHIAGSQSPLKNIDSGSREEQSRAFNLAVAGGCFEAPFWIALTPKSTSIWCSETKAKAKISLPCFLASKSMFLHGDSGFENESIATLSTRFFQAFFRSPRSRSCRGDSGFENGFENGRFGILSSSSLINELI